MADICHSNGFPDPYDEVLAGGRLTIEFYGYQGAVEEIDLNTCIRYVDADVTGNVTAGRGDFKMGPGPYVWSAGGVWLYLSAGEGLTWGRFSMVPGAVRRFVMANGMREMQFVLLWRGLGPVGFGQLSAMGAVTRLGMVNESSAGNSFTDPFDREFPSVGLTIEFYGYRGVVAPQAMSDCVSAAWNDVVFHLHESARPTAMAAEDYEYSAGGVDLFLRPGERLTWQMWAFVPAWIQEFVTENGFRGTQFILLYEGLGPMGYGQVVGTADGLSIAGVDVA